MLLIIRTSHLPGHFFVAKNVSNITPPPPISSIIPRKRSKTRWGPRPSTTQMAESSFTDNGSLDESKVGGRANRQYLEHIIKIDDEDSTPKTQPRHIVDSDDETNASSSTTNSHCDDSGQSNIRTLDSISPCCTHSGSHSRLTGDESIGFNNLWQYYGSVSSNSISALDRQYRQNNILWNKPAIINNNNINDNAWKKYYPVIHSNIFLVIEGPPTTGCAQVGMNERSLDHERWKTRHTPSLICIAPPDRGSCQSYLLFDARECHYEVFGDRLIESIRGTNLSILLLLAGGTNTRSAHCYVINKQKYLDGFSSTFQQMEALSPLKKYQDIRISTKSNKRHVAAPAPADFGICSKYFDFVLLYQSGCSITSYLCLILFYFLTRFLFLLILFLSLFIFLSLLHYLSLFSLIFLPFYSLSSLLFFSSCLCFSSLPLLFVFYVSLPFPFLFLLWLCLSFSLFSTFSLIFFFVIFSFPLCFSFYFCCVSGNCCTHKPDPKQRTDPDALWSHLSTKQQADILNTGSTLSRLRSGTLEEPLWFRTYQTLPDKKNKNLIVIVNRFNLNIDTPEQADGLVCSISIVLSNVRKILTDNTCVEHETCKYWRFLRQNSEKWYTWCFPKQVMYNAYDPLLMLDKQTRNQVVVILQTGRKQSLFRTSIIGEWHLNDDGYTTTLSIEQLVCSTLLQEYIPITNATVDTFLALWVIDCLKVRVNIVKSVPQLCWFTDESDLFQIKDQCFYSKL